MRVLWGKRPAISFFIILIEQRSYNGLTRNCVPAKPYLTTAKDLLCVCHIYNRGQVTWQIKQTKF